MSDASDHFFVVGETYEDRAGQYKVLSLEAQRVFFEYADGTQGSGSIEIKERIHQNILSERTNKQVGSPTPKPRLTNSRSHKEVFFTHAEVFPIIADVIENHSKHSDDYMRHGEIGEALMNHPEGGLILDRLPGHETRSWWANDMVAFFSKVFTEGRSEWDGRFERKKIDGKWAYRVRTPEAC
jgi:hypothetical protein